MSSPVLGSQHLRCQICNGAEDTWRHALIDCTMSKCVWSLIDEEIVEHLIACNSSDARLWMVEMMESMQAADFVKVLVTLWAIWWARRKAIHESEFQSPLSTFKFIENFMANLALIPGPSTVRMGGSTSSIARGQINRRWIPPSQGRVKINVDAAISRNNDIGSFVAICRDEQGMYLGSSAVVVQDLVHPEILEAMAFNEALALAADLYQRKVHIGTDCMATINHLKENYMGSSSTIIHEIKLKMRELEDVRMEHEKREHNGEAHNLAKASSSLDLGRHLWLTDTPQFMYLPHMILVD